MAQPTPSRAQSPTRRRNPRGQGDRLRTDLLDAAADLMAQHGSVDKVSVRSVAAVAGVSPTAVYRHFDNHTDLLWASVHHSFAEFALALECSADAADPFDRLAHMGHAYIDFAMNHTGKYRVMFSNRVPLPPTETPPGVQTFELLVEVVEACLAKRSDPRDPSYVSTQLWTWIHGMVDLMGNHPDVMQWPDVDQLLLDMCVGLDLVALDN